MPPSSILAEDVVASGPEGPVAVLTLHRGVSGWGNWVFGAVDAGSAISVGSAPESDWHIASPGVPRVTVLFTGHSLMVHTEAASPDLTLNDAPLWSGWVSLEHGDTLRLGPALIQATYEAPGRELDLLDSSTSVLGAEPEPEHQAPVSKPMRFAVGASGLLFAYALFVTVLDRC